MTINSDNSENPAGTDSSRQPHVGENPAGVDAPANADDSSPREDSLERLIEMLSDGDAQTRGMVATAFSRVKDPKTVEPLIALLGDEDAHVRSAAATALGAQDDDRAVKPLIDAAHNMDDDALRANSIAALARLARPGSFNTVVAALFDLDPAVRRNAAAAAGRLGDPRALEPVLMLLADEDPQVRANASWAAGQLGAGEAKAEKALIEAVERELDAQARSAQFIALGTIATPGALDRALAEAVDPEATPNSRIAAIIATTDAVTQRLEADPEAASRAAARLRPALVGLIAHAEDDELRATAAWAAGHLPETPSEVLAGADGTSDDVSDKPSAARSATDADSRGLHERTVAALIDALSDPYRWVVAYAIESLAILKDPAAEKFLRALAQTRDDDLATLAAQAADVVAGTAAMPGKGQASAPHGPAPRP